MAKKDAASKSTAPKKGEKKAAEAGKSATRKSAAQETSTPETPADAPAPEVAAKKKGSAKKEKEPAKARTNKDGQALNSGVSDYLRSIMKPTTEHPNVVAVTFGEANKAVQEKFKRKLYPSEFDRNFEKMKKEFAALDPAIVLEKQPPRFKAKEEKPEATAPATEKPVKAKGKKKVDRADAEPVVEAPPVDSAAATDAEASQQG